MTRTILVGAHLDHAESDAVGLAVALARPLGAGIVLGGVHVPSGRGEDTGERDRLEKGLAALRAKVPDDVEVAIATVDATSVVKGLHDLAEARAAELLVLGARHRGGLLRSLRGDVASEAAFTMPCGVAVAHPAETSGPALRVGVAWDQSAEANAALEWGIRLVERAGGSVRILRALDPSHPEGTHPGTHDQVRLRAAEDETRLRVDAAADVLWGDAAPELVKASRQLDLLVLGAHEHSHVRRLVFGTVSSRLLHEAHCPVVVLPAAA